MFYVARKIYIENNNPLTLHVIQVEHGRVVSIFPFDVERPSMELIDAVFLSNSTCPEFKSLPENICKEASSVKEFPAYAFKIVDNGVAITLERLY